MTQDPYDIAYQWGWDTSELHDLVYLCYKTPNFVENARRYHQSEEFQEVVAILSELGKKPEIGVHVLDFGCGNGIASYALNRMGYAVTGVDSSLGEIAGLNAARKIQNLDNSNFNLIHSTGENLDFPDEVFDVVWIREALHHIKDLDGFLLEIKRVLKPNGILCCLRDVVIWNEDQRKFFFDTHPFHPITQDEGCYYLEEYLNAFKRTRLQIERILYPGNSVINTYPNPVDPNFIFDEFQARSRLEAYDLFSFFMRKTEVQSSDQPPFDQTNSGMNPDLERSIFHLNAGQTSEALEQLNQLQTREGLPALGQYAKSIALARLDRTSEAIACLESLIAQQPEHLQAQRLLTALESFKTAGADRFEPETQFYGSVALNLTTLKNIATSPELWQELLSFHGSLATDEYVAYVDGYYRDCIQRFGPHWYYLDIVNVLLAASKTIQPKNYLEIGVRRGRSACVVARGCPSVNVFAFDLWMPNYAGMENPGPAFVTAELKKQGHQGQIVFVDGDSHQTVPQFFAEHPELRLDLITVDGDHSEAGALDDLCNVIPRLAVGGVLVFDDIAHPEHLYLLDVWQKAIAQFPYMSSFEFTETGYGIGFALRTTE
ncbi:MAG TPA: methyltransferase domain-containing protein [Coleofasciculaceae cyanobacterium]